MVAKSSARKDASPPPPKETAKMKEARKRLCALEVPPPREDTLLQSALRSTGRKHFASRGKNVSFADLPAMSATRQDKQISLSSIQAFEQRAKPIHDAILQTVLSEPAKDECVLSGGHRFKGKYSFKMIKQELTPPPATMATSPRWRKLQEGMKDKTEPPPQKKSAKKEKKGEETTEKPDTPKKPATKKTEPETPEAKPKRKTEPEKPEKKHKGDSSTQKAADRKKKKLGGKSKKHKTRRAAVEQTATDDAGEPSEAVEQIVSDDAAGESGTPEKDKKNEKCLPLVNRGGRNSRCAARMRFGRAQRAMRDKIGKTYEEGDKNKIPRELWEDVEADPDGCFEKYFKRGCDWQQYLREEKEETIDSTEGCAARTWVFENTLYRKICGRNKKRFRMMKMQLEEDGFVRFHPDMKAKTDEEKACARQYHALTLDEQKNKDVFRKTNIQSRRTDSPKKRRSTAEAASPPLKKKAKTDEDESPSPTTPKTRRSKEKDGEAQDGAANPKTDPKKDPKKGAKEGGKGQGPQDDDAAELSSKEKAAAQKEKLKKDQEKKAKDAAKKSDPLERAKTFMNSVPTQIRELRVAQSEVATKKVKLHVPPRFLKEYETTVAAHVKQLVQIRNDMESSIGKEPKAFIKKLGGVEVLDGAEKEMEKSRKTLKSWRNAMHVYLNGTDGKET